ncbi:MAG: response regulator [Pseudomonadota bacterium]
MSPTTRLGIADPELHVLLVDDDQNHWYIVRGALDALDVRCDMTACPNGQEALNYLRDSEIAGNLPDIILLDLVMPHMSGQEFLLRLTEDDRDYNVPIVVLSDSPDDIVMKHPAVTACARKADSFAGMMQLVRSILAYCDGPNPASHQREDGWVLSGDLSDTDFIFKR